MTTLTSDTQLTRRMLQTRTKTRLIDLIMMYAQEIDNLQRANIKANSKLLVYDEALDKIANTIDTHHHVQFFVDELQTIARAALARAEQETDNV